MKNHYTFEKNKAMKKLLTTTAILMWLSSCTKPEPKVIPPTTTIPPCTKVVLSDGSIWAKLKMINLSGDYIKDTFELLQVVESADSISLNYTSISRITGTKTTSSARSLRYCNADTAFFDVPNEIKGEGHPQYYKAKNAAFMSGDTLKTAYLDWDGVKSYTVTITALYIKK